MEYIFANKCLEFFNAEVDEITFTEQRDELIHFLNDVNSRQDIRFAIFHYYDINEETKGDNLKETDLSLFETVHLLDEYNSNVSSYEVYYPKVIE